jgi:hypothetical protein
MARAFARVVDDEFVPSSKGPLNQMAYLARARGRKLVFDNHQGWPKQGAGLDFEVHRDVLALERPGGMEAAEADPTEQSGRMDESQQEGTSSEDSPIEEERVLEGQTRRNPNRGSHRQGVPRRKNVERGAGITNQSRHDISKACTGGPTQPTEKTDRKARVRSPEALEELFS